MAGIALLDGDDDHEALRWRRQVDAFDIWHAGLFHAVPHRRGAQAGTIHAVNRRLERRRAGNNRIVAMVERLDANERLGTLRAGLVARTLAERSFWHRLTGNDFAFDDDFGICRETQSGHRSLDHVDRLTDQTAGPIVFVDAERHSLRSRDVEQRMLAECHRHGKWLAGLHGFLIMNLAVLPGRDIQPDLVFVVQHDAIAADVLDAGFRIARHDEMSRAEVTAAV